MRLPVRVSTDCSSQLEYILEETFLLLYVMSSCKMQAGKDWFRYFLTSKQSFLWLFYIFLYMPLYNPVVHLKWEVPCYWVRNSHFIDQVVLFISFFLTNFNDCFPSTHPLVFFFNNHPLYFCSIRLVSHTQRGTIYPPLITVAYTDVLVQNPETQSVMVRSLCHLNHTFSSVGILVLGSGL